MFELESLVEDSVNTLDGSGAIPHAALVAHAVVGCSTYAAGS
jgi:hypothetical protein